MVLIIKKKSGKKPELKELTSKLKSKKLFKASEYCGKVKVRGDAVILQRKLRDEWK